MSALSESINDLLGKNVKTTFHVPVGDVAQFQYDTKFGIDADYTLNCGLLVTAPAATQIEVYAAFRGQLFASPSLTGDADDNILTLCIAPAEALHLCTLLTETETTLAQITYYGIDLAEAAKGIEKALTAQGLVADELKNAKADFLAGTVGVFVEAGQWIGAGLAGGITVGFEDADGYMLHPHYLLWLLWKSANNLLLALEPTNHGLITALQLPQSQFTLADGIVTLPGGSEEPFTLAFP